MKISNNVSQYRKLEMEPVPSNVKVGSYLTGKNLPNSEIENVRGGSLCPLYTDKQL
jgi:hypothetical protein